MLALLPSLHKLSKIRRWRAQSKSFWIFLVRKILNYCDPRRARHPHQLRKIWKTERNIWFWLKSEQTTSKSIIQSRWIQLRHKHPSKTRLYWKGWSNAWVKPSTISKACLKHLNRGRTRFLAELQTNSLVVKISVILSSKRIRFWGRNSFSWMKQKGTQTQLAAEKCLRKETY